MNLKVFDRTSISTDFEFGHELEFLESLEYDSDVRLKYLLLILKENYYFDPKYYNFDTSDRIIYTLDSKIGIQLNFDFLSIDKRYLYLIMSVMQLNLLEILDNDSCDNYIEIIAAYLNLKVEYQYKQKFAFFQRLVNGKEVERKVLVLTSEEFNSSIVNRIAKMRNIHTHFGFSVDTS